MTRLAADALYSFFSYACQPEVIVACILIVIAVFFRYRCFYRQSRQQCFFCHRLQRIKRGREDRWQCPSCEQWNGFNTSGNTYEPPEFVSEAHGTVEEQRRRAWQLERHRHHYLGAICELKQSTYISLLAAFEGPAS